MLSSTAGFGQKRSLDRKETDIQIYRPISLAFFLTLASCVPPVLADANKLAADRSQSDTTRNAISLTIKPERYDVIINRAVVINVHLKNMSAKSVCLYRPTD